MLTYVCTVFEECKSIWRTIVERCIIKRGSSIIKYRFKQHRKLQHFLSLFIFFKLSISCNALLASLHSQIILYIFDKTVPIFKNDLYIFYST